MKRQSNSLTPKRKGMAQEKIPNEKPKRTRKPKAGSDALPVEQITELMLVHNKNDLKFGVQAVSEIDKDGKAKTVPADEKNENSFLKFDKNSSILENFIKNFWSQLKEPTLHIHDGVNTSAISRERAVWVSRLLRIRGMMTCPLSLVIRQGRIGESY